MDALRGYTGSGGESDDGCDLDDGEASGSSLLKSRLPPLPEDFNAEKSAPTVPQEGRFSAHISLGCPVPASNPEFANFLDRLSARARLSLVGASHKPALNPVPHKLHVSLSRSADILASQIKPLLAALRDALVGVPCGRFVLTDALLALPGGKGAGELTYFAAPVAEESTDGVVSLISRVDRAVAAVEIPRFYNNPRPHMSFLRAEGFDMLEKCDPQGKLFQDRSVQFECIYEAVYCSIGCQTYSIGLSP